MRRSRLVREPRDREHETPAAIRPRPVRPRRAAGARRRRLHDRNATLRAGPDTGYPRIRTLATGTPVAVRGCIDDYLGCDVVAHGDRGWVAGDYVAFEYDDRPVHVADYGARIGVPIVSFVFGTTGTSTTARGRGTPSVTASIVQLGRSAPATAGATRRQRRRRAASPTQRGACPWSAARRRVGVRRRRTTRRRPGASRAWRPPAPRATDPHPG